MQQCKQLTTTASRLFPTTPGPSGDGTVGDGGTRREQQEGAGSCCEIGGATANVGHEQTQGLLECDELLTRELCALDAVDTQGLTLLCLLPLCSLLFLATPPGNPLHSLPGALEVRKERRLIVHRVHTLHKAVDSCRNKMQKQVPGLTGD